MFIDQDIAAAARHVNYFDAKDVENLCALASQIMEIDFLKVGRIDKGEIHKEICSIVKKTGTSMDKLFTGQMTAPLRPREETDVALFGSLNLLSDMVWGRLWMHILKERVLDPFFINMDYRPYKGIYHAVLRWICDFLRVKMDRRFHEKTSKNMPADVRRNLQNFFMPAVWGLLLQHLKGIHTPRYKHCMLVTEYLNRFLKEGYGVMYCGGSEQAPRVEIRVPVWDEKAYPEIVDCEGSSWLEVSVLKDSVFVPEKVWRYPERLSAQDIFNEPNVEVRRVMLETMGNEKFLKESQAERIDKTPKYELFRVTIPSAGRRLAEFLHLVHCVCPSTGHEYYLRVPPPIRSAEEAIAWTFGESRWTYEPAVET